MGAFKRLKSELVYVLSLRRLSCSSLDISKDSSTNSFLRITLTCSFNIAEIGKGVDEMSTVSENEPFWNEIRKQISELDLPCNAKLCTRSIYLPNYQI